MGIVSIIFALVALFGQDGATPSAEYVEAIIGSCTPVYEPGTFVGCEAPNPKDPAETLYAGQIWVTNVDGDNGEVVVTIFDFGP